MKAIDIGIDLGMYEIKIAKVDEVKPDSGSDLNYLKDYESYPVNSEIYSEDYFKEVKKAIKNFSKKIGKSRLSLNFALSNNEHTNVLFATIPAVSEKDLNMGIKFEAEQLLAGQNTNDYEVTWKVIHEHEEINENEVLIATLSLSVLTSLSKFKTINWKVNRIMLQPILLERFAKTNDVIIDLGYKETRIYMYKDGNLAETETLNMGTHDVETHIESYLEGNAENYEDDIEEIMDKLHVQNEFIDSEGTVLDEIANEIEPLISRLLDEIKRIIRTFELQNGLDIDEVYYMGGLFNRLAYLDNKLESELDFSIQPLNIVSKDIDDVKYDIAALAVISPRTKDKMDFAQFVRANIDYPSILTAVLTVSLSVSIAFGVMDSKYEDVIESQLANESRQVQEIGELDNYIMQSQESIERNQRFISMIDDLKGQQKWLSDILYVLPENTPLSIVIEDLNITDGVVELGGYSADYSSIGFFAEKLEKYGQVEIESIEEYGSGGSGESEGGRGKTMYSVVTDTPETISDKYLMSKEFKIILNYSGTIGDH